MNTNKTKAVDMKITLVINEGSEKVTSFSLYSPATPSILMPDPGKASKRKVVCTIPDENENLCGQAILI